MPTMQQLAKLAGVSVATISMALRDDQRISLKTRQRIKQLAVEYGYLPSRLTRAVHPGRSGVLGCLTHRHLGPLYSPILQGALGEAYRNDYSVVVSQVERDIGHLTLAVQNLLEHNIEGIILMTTSEDKPFPKDIFLMIHSYGVIPAAATGNQIQVPIDCAQLDEKALADSALSYLWSLGHRNIGYIWQSTAAHLVDYRMNFFRKAFERHGLPLTFFRTIADLEDLTTTGDRWLETSSRPTAIIFDGDNLAEGFMLHILSRGIRIPNDISILGVGNFLGSIYFSGLTTFDPNPVKIGEEAVKMLLGRISEGKAPGEYAPEIRSIAPTLIERKTCAPPPKEIRPFPMK